MSSRYLMPVSSSSHYHLVLFWGLLQHFFLVLLSWWRMTYLEDKEDRKLAERGARTFMKVRQRVSAVSPALFHAMHCNIRHVCCQYRWRPRYTCRFIPLTVQLIVCVCYSCCSIGYGNVLLCLARQRDVSPRHLIPCCARHIVHYRA